MTCEGDGDDDVVEGGGDGDGVKWIPALTSGETSCAPDSEGGMEACDGGHAGGAWSCTGA
jgi:hypothetical protein